MIRRVMRREEGAIAPMVALLLVVLVGFCALVLDFGTIYANRRALQNAADSAALAGAKELQLELLGGSMDPGARRQASDWASSNGIVRSDAMCTPDSQATMFYNGANPNVAYSWQVDTSRLVRLNFGPVIGVPTMCVTAHAVAVVTGVTEPKVFPWAVLAGTTLPPYAVPGDYGKNCLNDPRYCLELTTTNSGVLDFTCAHNSRDYSYWWQNGFGTRPGEPVPTVRSNWTACGGPAQDNLDLQTFLDQIWSNMPVSCHWDPPQPNFQCPLMGMLPIVRETRWPGGSGTVTIVNMIPFKMLHVVDDGNGHLDVIGHIIQTVDGVGPGGVGQTQLPPSDGSSPRGPTGIRLIQ